MVFLTLSVYGIRSSLMYFISNAYIFLNTATDNIHAAAQYSNTVKARHLSIINLRAVSEITNQNVTTDFWDQLRAIKQNKSKFE